MHVLKFGGTSMGDEQTWRQVLDIISRYDHPVVVVSATSRTTRQLFSAAGAALHDLKEAQSISQSIKKRHESLIANFMAHYPDQKNREPGQACNRWITERITELEHYLEQISENGCAAANIKDAIASLGEQLSSYLFARCGAVYGLNMQWVDARNIIKTDSEFGKANPDTGQINRSARLLADIAGKNGIPVMGGYYGENEQGEITTLGFEGSDFTAGLIGAALDARAVEIWTDVSGIFTCDPRLIPDAKPIGELSFSEATELAYFGAKVLHPSTMKPASQKQIPIFVKNIFDPGHPGTKIHVHARDDGLAKALTFIEDVVILTVTSTDILMGYQFLAKVFAVLEEQHIAVDAVTTTEASVSLALQASDRVRQIGDHFQDLGEVSFREQQGLISLIGCRFENAGAITQNVLSVIPDSRISMISYSQSKNNINLVVPQSQLIPSVRAIHAKLFAAGDKA